MAFEMYSYIFVDESLSAEDAAAIAAKLDATPEERKQLPSNSYGQPIVDGPTARRVLQAA